MANKTALVLGLGASGAACARHLASLGWHVRATDTREEPPGLAALREEIPQLEFASGMQAGLLAGCSLVAISPGLSPEHSAASAIVAQARRSGIALVSEVELFGLALASLKAECGYSPAVIGITGTNGKTTTTSMVGEAVAACGRSVCVAGNIGPNVLDELAKARRAGSLPEFWVLELSSFQLETTCSLVCRAAALLNLTQDHIDWHGSMQAYALAKCRVFSSATVRVLNRRDPMVMELAGLPGAVTFGSDASERGWSVAGGIVRCDGAEVFRTADLSVRGMHNVENAMAAAALCEAAGLPRAPVVAALCAYRGKPHRVEFVAEIGGVEFIEDSKGTNVGATAAALEGFAAEGKKSVVILGGDGKGQDFSPLAESLRRCAAGVVLIGRDGPAIGRIVDPAIPRASATTVPEATRLAASMAKPGQIVLLSPACASWDMFPSYKVRAKVFTDTVLAIKQEA